MSNISEVIEHPFGSSLGAPADLFDHAIGVHSCADGGSNAVGRQSYRGSDNDEAPLGGSDVMAAKPTPSSPQVSKRMSKALRRDTLPEMLIRREAYRRGLRYRVDASLPGMPRRRADMVFIGRRVAVFVDGCFWHSCPQHHSVPRANREWWLEKLRRNTERDRETDAHLRELGWTVLRFWEHEEPVMAVDVIEHTVHY
jgi:DNA mismatch endonuclease (patch repair protein)